MPLAKEGVYGALVAIDGSRLELSRSQYDELRTHLRVIRGGKTADREDDPMITTGEAAAILGVSRRTVTRILDRGVIPCIRLGSGYRRMRKSDVVRYDQEWRARRHEALEEMRAIAYESGMDDLEMIDECLKQFDDDPSEA